TALPLPHDIPTSASYAVAHGHIRHRSTGAEPPYRCRTSARRRQRPAPWCASHRGPRPSRPPLTNPAQEETMSPSLVPPSLPLSPAQSRRRLGTAPTLRLLTGTPAQGPPARGSH